MSGAIAWRDSASDMPREGAVVVVSLLPGIAEPAPTSRDLDEAPPREPRRARFFARRTFTRRIVAARLKVAADHVTIAHAPDGSPRVVVPECALRLSISGRDDFCAVGVAPCAIGVDLEPLGAVVEPAWNVLHARERAVLDALSGAARHEMFLRLWTAKEAYVKALGQGLSREPAQIEIVAIGADAFTVREARLRAGAWRSVDLDGRRFIAACALLDCPLS